MPKVALAEWILSCTMPLDRAGAAAGDLAEAPGALSFWTSLIRLAASASFRSLIKSPVSFAWMALLLWFAFLLGCMLWAFGAWLMWAVLYLADNHTGLELITIRIGHPVPLVPPTGLSYVVGLVILPAALAWKIGGDLSRQSPGRELASWYALAIVWTALGLWAKLPPATIFLPIPFLLGGMLRRRWLA